MFPRAPTLSGGCSVPASRTSWRHASEVLPKVNTSSIMMTRREVGLEHHRRLARCSSTDGRSDDADDWRMVTVRSRAPHWWSSHGSNR